MKIGIRTGLGKKRISKTSKNRSVVYLGFDREQTRISTSERKAHVKRISLVIPSASMDMGRQFACG
jgi:hypothetical protein